MAFHTIDMSTTGSQLFFFILRAQFFFTDFKGSIFFSKNFRAQLFFQFYIYSRTPPPPPPHPEYLMVNTYKMKKYMYVSHHKGTFYFIVSTDQKKQLSKQLLSRIAWLSQGQSIFINRPLWLSSEIYIHLWLSRATASPAWRTVQRGHENVAPSIDKCQKRDGATDCYNRATVIRYFFGF